MKHSSPKLTFLNHASFMVENDDAVLLIDPWYEGSAFNQGWSLLDTSVKNDEVIKKLIEKNIKNELIIDNLTKKQNQGFIKFINNIRIKTNSHKYTNKILVPFYIFTFYNNSLITLIKLSSKS